MRYFFLRIFFMVLLICCCSSDVFAGAALMQAQRAKQMKAQQQAMAEQQAQQQYQQQYQEQVKAQQGAEVEAAQAQMMAQQAFNQQLQQQVASYLQQQQIQQVEQALAMRYLQQELQQRMAQAQIQQIQHVKQEMMQQAVAAAVARTVAARTLAQRDALAAKAYLQARNEAIAVYGNQAQAQAVGAYVSTPNRSRNNLAHEQVRSIVKMEQVWDKLDHQGKAWGLLIDSQAKVLTVNEYIERFRRENIKVNQSPAHYVQMIDAMSAQNPTMLDRPFKEIIQIVAIMEYDFDNGMDRDTLAHTVLGDAMYHVNKKRLGR